MTEKIERVRLMHGLIKGAVKNIIDLIHNRIPKEDLIINGVNKPRQPELANMCEAFNAAMLKTDMLLKEDAYDNHSGTPRMIVKGKDVVLSVLGSDSAYYLMCEYFLKEYVHIKMDSAFGKDAVEKAWFEQWNSKFFELKKLKEENTLIEKKI